MKLSRFLHGRPVYVVTESRKKNNHEPRFHELCIHVMRETNSAKDTRIRGKGSQFLKRTGSQQTKWWRSLHQWNATKRLPYGARNDLEPSEIVSVVNSLCRDQKYFWNDIFLYNSKTAHLIVFIKISTVFKEIAFSLIIDENVGTRTFQLVFQMFGVIF